MLVRVAIDLALDRLFTYEVPVDLCKEVKVGQLLRVPFGHREARGFALEVMDGSIRFDTDALNPQLETRNFKLKHILGIADSAPFFSPAMLKLVRWIADYTCSPIEICLKAAVPAAVLKPNAKPKELLFVDVTDTDGAKLTAYQKELLENIRRVGGGWVQQLCREFSTTPTTLRALATKGSVTIAPRVQRRDPLAGRSVLPSKPFLLNGMQRAALDHIVNPQSSTTHYQPILLHGVTGSGKTEG